VKRLKRIKKVHIIAVIVIIGVIAAGILLKRQPEQDKISYNQFLQSVKEGKVEKVYLDNSDQILGEYKNGESFITDNPRTEGFKEFLLVQDIEVDEIREKIQGDQLFSAIITLSIFGVLIFVVNRNMSRQKQGKAGKTLFNAILPENVKVNFNNIAGNEEAKESVQELVDFIKNPEKYAKYGARLPRGVILYGSPGTGKTLMAKAIAGESGVPFIAVSGSDFVQVYVGVGASRIRELFKKARSYGKCVIFIDEIDALGKKRDGGDGGGNDERDQTLNALLSEMSGFEDNEGIVVIAATNRLDTLDEALLRPGRFDRHIEIQLPDIKSRLKILELHSKNKPLEENITTGASNDLEKATGTLLNMIRRFGMNAKSGLLNYDVLYNNGFRQVEDEILEECRICMDELYDGVKALLQKNIGVLEAIAESLLTHETLEERDLDIIIQAYSQAG